MASILTADGEIIAYVDVVKDVRSPRISLSIDRSSAHRTVDVPYLQAETFAQFATGYPKLASYTSGSTTYAYIKRAVPWILPLKRNRGIFCSRCEWEGYGVPNAFAVNTFSLNLMRHFDADNEAFAVYQNARCALDYETPTYDVLDDQGLKDANEFYDIGDHDYDESTWLRYITKIVRPQGEFITIQGSNFNGYYLGRLKLANNRGFPINDSINKTVCATTITVTWHQVPEAAVPMAEFNEGAANTAIDNCIGRVNDRNFNGNPQGTLLLQAADIQPHKDSRGDRIYDITYTFKHFNPRPDAPIWTIPTGTAGLGGGNGTPIQVFAGHNHVYVPRPRLSGASIVFGGQFPADLALRQDWYEPLSDEDLARSRAGSNFFLKSREVNIYDWANLANLFRPATYTQV